MSTPAVARSMRPRAAFLQSRALRGGNDAKWRPGCAGAATAVTASSAAKAAWFVMPRARTATGRETEEAVGESNKVRGLQREQRTKRREDVMALVRGEWRRERV